MNPLTNEEHHRQDMAAIRFQEILAASGFAARHLRGGADKPVEERLDEAAQELASINRKSRGELFGCLGQTFFEASEIFYSNPFFATALMRAEFSPMAFDATGQAACFKRLASGPNYEKYALEIYRRAFEAGWDPEDPLDESGLGNPARNAFLAWARDPDGLSKGGRDIFELCWGHSKKFGLKEAKQAVKDHGWGAGAQGERARQALAFLSSLVDAKALDATATAKGRGKPRAPHL